MCQTKEHVEARTVVAQQTRNGMMDCTDDPLRFSTRDKDQNPIDKQNYRYPNATEDIRVPKVHENVQHFGEKDRLERWESLGK